MHSLALLIVAAGILGFGLVSKRIRWSSPPWGSWSPAAVSWSST